MAILEVHDALGQVQRVTLSREHPLMIGSSPRCDVVLAGDRVLPMHGRIRWHPRKKRFKVDASPDAQYVVVNGHKMSSSSLRPGDEIEVSGNRIFLISDNDPTYREAPPRDDATRVQPMPFLAPAAPPKPAKAPAPASPRRAPSPMLAALEEDFEELAPELTEPAPVAAPRPRPAPERGWGRFIHLFSARAYRPGGGGPVVAVRPWPGRIAPDARAPRLRALCDHSEDVRDPTLCPGGRRPRRGELRGLDPPLRRILAREPGG